MDDNSVDGTGGISTYLSGPICKFNWPQRGAVSRLYDNRINWGTMNRGGWGERGIGAERACGRWKGNFVSIQEPRGSGGSSLKLVYRSSTANNYFPLVMLIARTWAPREFHFVRDGLFFIPPRSPISLGHDRRPHDHARSNPSRPCSENFRQRSTISRNLDLYPSSSLSSSLVVSRIESN